MLLDQTSERIQKSKPDGNHQLLKGTTYAAITLVGFCILFFFVDMDWDHFSPLAPFYPFTHRNQYSFYFVCFCFFICSLFFTSIFYRKNLQPTDLLIRFAIVLITFIVVYALYQVFSLAVQQPKEIIFNSFRFFSKSSTLVNLMNGTLTFLCFYLLFYLLCLIFSKLFFHGQFGLVGFIFCLFLAAIYYIAVFYLAPMSLQLNQTKFPFSDFAVILFFSLLSFGIGILSGIEKQTIHNMVNQRKNHLRSL